MNKTRLIVQITFAPKTVISSLQVSLVVGIILNLINQWEPIITFNLNQLDIPKMMLTFLVPYLVSTYATIKAKM